MVTVECGSVDGKIVMLTVDVLFDQGGQDIHDYLLRNEKSLLYANPRFIGLVAEHLFAQSVWLLARRNGELVGVLPYLIKAGPLGAVFNSLAYFGSNGGVIQHNIDDEAKSALVDTFYSQALINKACSATLITNPLEQDAQFYNDAIDYDHRDERIGQITHFGNVGSEDDLLKLFEDPRPRNIRRAIKEGVTIEKSQSHEAVDFLFRTHEQNIHAIGGLSKDKAFFDEISKHMQNHEWAIFTAYLNGKPVAALLLFYFNRTVEYFTPATVEIYRGCQPLSLAIYRAMLDAVEHGFVNWNWGGTWLSQGGVYDFKKRWGTRDYPYFYYTKIFNSDVTQQSTQFLLEHYKGFFVIPFCRLQKQKD
jgi:hypothetical protein